MHKNKPLLLSSAFAALSLVFVLGTGGFSEKPTLRSQVAVLQHEVDQMRDSLGAQVTQLSPGGIVQQTCTPGLTPTSITITEPVAVQTYSSGQQMPIRWTTCNVPAGTAGGYVRFDLYRGSNWVATLSPQNIALMPGGEGYPTTLNDGIDSVMIPANLSGTDFKIRAQAFHRRQVNGYWWNTFVTENMSNGFFTLSPIRGTITSTPVVACSNSSATTRPYRFTITPTGGTGAYTYAWNVVPSVGTTSTTNTLQKTLTVGQTYNVAVTISSGTYPSVTKTMTVVPTCSNLN